MDSLCHRLTNFDCDQCSDKDFGFQKKPDTQRLYKFPTTIGAEGKASILFVGINPRFSPSNLDLHQQIASDLKAFDELSRNKSCGRPYVAVGGKEKHYRQHARIVEAAMKGNEVRSGKFEQFAACTELFLCATQNTRGASRRLAEMLQRGESPCVDKFFWDTLKRVQPTVVIAVGKLVCEFLKRFSKGNPPRLDFDLRPALLSIPHPNDTKIKLSDQGCNEIGKICRELILRAPDNDSNYTYTWNHRKHIPPVEGNLTIRDINWSDEYGWKPHHRATELDWLEENAERKIRYRLVKHDACRYHLDLDASELRGAIGNYVDGSHWRRTGYVNPITKFVSGSPTENIKAAWKKYATPHLIDGEETIEI